MHQIEADTLLLLEDGPMRRCEFVEAIYGKHPPRDLFDRFDQFITSIREPDRIFRSVDLRLEALTRGRYAERLRAEEEDCRYERPEFHDTFVLTKRGRDLISYWQVLEQSDGRHA